MPRELHCQASTNIMQHGAVCLKWSMNQWCNHWRRQCCLWQGSDNIAASIYISLPLPVSAKYLKSYGSISMHFQKTYAFEHATVVIIFKFRGDQNQKSLFFLNYTQEQNIVVVVVVVLNQILLGLIISLSITFYQVTRKRIQAHIIRYKVIHVYTDYDMNPS